MKPHTSAHLPGTAPGPHKGGGCGGIGKSVSAKCFLKSTVRPKTHSDLIPWAQKIEFESCK